MPENGFDNSTGSLTLDRCVGADWLLRRLNGMKNLLLDWSHRSRVNSDILQVSASELILRRRQWHNNDDTIQFPTTFADCIQFCSSANRNTYTNSWIKSSLTNDVTLVVRCARPKMVSSRIVSRHRVCACGKLRRRFGTADERIESPMKTVNRSWVITINAVNKIKANQYFLCCCPFWMRQHKKIRKEFVLILWFLWLCILWLLEYNALFVLNNSNRYFRNRSASFMPCNKKVKPKF